MAAFVPPEVLDQILAANEIVDVIGAVLPLKRAGGNFVALCPFHREKTPSFNINPHKQVFHCFGCQVGGNAFTFLQKYENLTFIEAVRRLAERAKIPLQYDDSSKGGGRPLKDKLLHIHEQITQRWHSALLHDAQAENARHYLARRGVSSEGIALFRLGFAPESWEDTVKWAGSQGFDLPLVEQSGLIIKKEERYYGRFRGRLMFPICDEQGRVIAFSGRILSPEQPGGKYVNSPETPLFTKSRVFYGLDKSKRAILEARSAIICEGQLDLIACFMAGITNVTAPQGTAFTSDHASILKRYAEEAVLCFDSDAAGQNAAIRAMDSLLSSGLAIRVAVIPAPHDPDSFIRQHGPAPFRDLIASSPGFFDFYLEFLCTQNDPGTDKGRLAITSAMGGAVFKTGSPVLVDKYSQKTALRLGVSAEAMRAAFKKLKRPSVPLPPADAPGEEEAPRPPAHELWLLKLLLRHDELLPFASDHLDLGWISHADVRRLAALRLEAHRQEQSTGIASLLARLDQPALQALVTSVTAEDHEIPAPGQQIRDLTLRLRNDALDRQGRKILQQASRPDLSEEQELQLLRQLEEVRRLKKEQLQALHPGQAADPF